MFPFSKLEGDSYGQADFTSDRKMKYFTVEGCFLRMRSEKIEHTFATCWRAKACGGQPVVTPDGKRGGVNRRYGHLEPSLAENIEAPGTPLSILVPSLME